MRAVRAACALVALCALAAISGCVIAPLPPSYPYAAPGGVAEGPTVGSAPPPPRVEVVPVAPAPAYVWIGGYWGWNAGRYAWIGGRWALPPPGYRAWAPGYWGRYGPGWRWHGGRWRR